MLERQIRALDPTIRALRRVVGSNWRPPAAPEQEERGKPARPGRKRPEVGPGREERVLAILRNAGAPVPARLVMEQSGFDDSVVYTALKQLREKGQVRFAGTAPNKQGRDVSLFATYPEEA